MELNINNFKHNELQKWYRRSINLAYKKTLNDEISKMKDYSIGNNALYIGLLDFKKKFESKSHLSYMALNNVTDIKDNALTKKLPFADNSHDVIVIVHALDYIDNPYDLVREIDRIATDDARVLLVGFNKFSIWGAVKNFTNDIKAPWSMNFHSLYSVREWFKLLGYDTAYKETAVFFPFISKKLIKYFSKFSFLQKLLASNLGGIYFYAFNKKVTALTPMKLKFKDKYLITPFSKSTTN